jgi:predicted GNAT superfamily acetyltransferase
LGKLAQSEQVPHGKERVASMRELAFDWRLKTRRIFQRYFSSGYVVVALHRSEDRAHYRLQKREA